MFLRLRLPLLLTLLAGLIPIIAFFFKDDATFIKKPNSWLEQDMVIVSGFALLLGVVNVVQSNVRKIERREKGWLFAAVLLFGMFFMGIFGAAGAMRLGGLPGIGNYPNGTPTPFAWGSVYMFTPLQSTMFALLAFYIASAAFRAFRVRNLEATILLVAAVFVMLGRIPVGEGAFGSVTEWMMQVPNGAAQRGIIIGAALGAASLSLRVILGIERSYLGLEKSE
ncbi:MAG: hypothetical protein IT349_11405 [Candidatus Eisenbacteria bacterium]|nr:hypothetical protein [Candidatus Eisenbacteria bacterium]MCC7142695.1 hypothetical protein [Candidatus Eisenbacteria bacterium]